MRRSGDRRVAATKAAVVRKGHFSSYYRTGSRTDAEFRANGDSAAVAAAAAAAAGGAALATAAAHGGGSPVAVDGSRESLCSGGEAQIVFV